MVVVHKLLSEYKPAQAFKVVFRTNHAYTMIIYCSNSGPSIVMYTLSQNVGFTITMPHFRTDVVFIQKSDHVSGLVLL